jgi:hypothetical protein
MTIAADYNKWFAIAGVPCFADAFLQGGSSVLRMKFRANNSRHRKDPKRYSLVSLNQSPTPHSVAIILYNQINHLTLGEKSVNEQMCFPRS